MEPREPSGVIGSEAEGERGLRAYLFAGVTTLMIVMIAGLGVALGIRHAMKLGEASSDRLSLISDVVSRSVDEHLESHAAAVLTAADVISSRAFEPGTIQASLETVHSHNPKFRTMIVTDDRGMLLAASPPMTSEGILVLSLAESVADRDYFQEAMRTRQLFISDVFLGRGFGRDAIVAVSAPILVDEEPVGVVEGSLDLSRLKDFEQFFEQADPLEIIVVDQKDRVIYASEESEYPSLTPLENRPLLESMQSAKRPVFRYEAVGGDTYQVARSETSNGWTVLAQQPLAVVQRAILIDAVMTTAFVVVAILATVALVRLLASRLSRPLEQLTELIRESRVGARINLGSEEEMPVEVRELVRALNNLGEKLRRSHDGLLEALRKEESLRSSLENEREHLRQEIRERERIGKHLEIVNRRLTASRDLALEGSRAKSSFLRNMSHELRTPLNSIVGFSDILDMRMSSAEEPERRAIENIRASARRMLQLVDRLMQIALLEEVPLNLRSREVDAAEILRSVIDEVQTLKTASSDIVLEAGSGPDVLLDADAFRQAIGHVLEDAAVLAGEGRVRVRVGLEGEGEEELLVIRVGSSWNGLDLDRLNSLLEPFGDVHEDLLQRHGGAGLGLAIGRRMSEMMGGSLVIGDGDEEGETVIIIRLPAGGS